MVSFWAMLILLIGLQVATFSPNTLAKGPRSGCSGHRVTPPSDRTWLPLHHRHGPCSPSHSAGIRTSLASSLRRDKPRAQQVGRQLSMNNGSSADVTVPTTLGTSFGTLQYVVSVGLGTPAVPQTVFIDTGSDISWVQCRPCLVPPCHRQKGVVFNPSNSSTYYSFPCGSAACARLGDESSNGCSNSHCDYVVKYGDGSNTTGTYSSDTLTMASTALLHKFLFGCSHAELGFPDSDRTDGLLGLGGGELSLVSQTGEKAFSYCLPPTESHSGFFTLGVPRISSSRFAVTPMYGFAKAPTPYVLILTAITVAGRRLDVPQSVFSAGSIMDSGTIITRLPPTAYRALRAAFRAEMKMYSPAPPMDDIFDTCFNMSGVGSISVPSVGLVFERGATLELDQSGIMLNNCLAFTTNDGDDSVGFIGNVQQRTFEVLYDVGGEAFGFRRGAC
ncbi:unnamed protein product [Alopecurus aequalis]